MNIRDVWPGQLLVVREFSHGVQPGAADDIYRFWPGELAIPLRVFPIEGGGGLMQVELLTERGIVLAGASQFELL
jgi:hypothetical protein